MNREEMLKVFYKATMTALGHDADKVYRKEKPPVRVSYPEVGAPDWKYGDNVVFLFFTDISDDTTQPIHEKYETSADGKYITRTHYSNRVIELSLTAYGPDSYENMIKVRHAFFDGMPILEAADLKVILSPTAVGFMPELFGNVWWRRADIKIQFNHTEIWSETVTPIEIVPISIKDNPGTSNTTNEENGEITKSGIFIKKG